MVSGAGRVTAPRQDSTVRLGDIVAIPPGLPRRVFPLRGMRFVSLHLHPRFVAEQVEWFTPSHPMTRLLKSTLSEVTEFHILRLSPSAVQTFASTLPSLTCIESQNYSWFFTMAHVAILFDYAGRLESTPRTGLHQKQTNLYPREEISRAISIMQNDLQHHWRISDLAAKVLLSPSQLTRLFRRHVNCSPLKFLNQLRADHMAKTLVAYDASVTEAAKQVGWSDLPTASRLFKQRHGMSPTRYRAHHRPLN
ncbi:helix-turn-helix domain-containing protein [Leucobacter sp. GX24907]